MYLKMKTIFANPTRLVPAGRIAEFTAEEAKQLIDGDYAEKATEQEFREQQVRLDAKLQAENTQRAIDGRPPIAAPLRT